jgi:four helix bundle protein
MRNFRELKIWKKAFQIATNSFRITESFLKHEKFSFGSQINRASISIPSNIAEGCSRSSNKDCIRFLEISIGSCFELETQLLIAKELKCGNQELILYTLELLTEEEKMLTAFKISLKHQLNRNS